MRWCRPSLIVLFGLFMMTALGAGQRDGPAATGGSRAVGHERAESRSPSPYDAALRDLGITRDVFEADLRRTRSMPHPVDARTLLIIHAAARGLTPLTAAATVDETLRFVADGRSLESALSSAAHTSASDTSRQLVDAKTRIDKLLKR